jgi:hypothetical protein
VRIEDGTLVDSGIGVPWQVETLCSNGPTLYFTESDGRFVLNGLANREYVIRVIHPETLAYFLSDPISADSTNVVLRVPDGLLIPKVSGHVVTEQGVAAPGLFVALVSRGNDWSGPSVRGDIVVTDSKGAFVLDNVPRNSATIAVYGPEIIPKRFETEQAGVESGVVRIMVSKRAYLSVKGSWRTRGGLHSIELSNSDGPVAIYSEPEPPSGVFLPFTSQKHTERVRLAGERRLFAGEGPYDAVLYCNGEIAGRTAIVLVGGSHTDIDVRGLNCCEGAIDH